MAQAALTAYAAVAHPSSSPPTTMLTPALAGQIVYQVTTYLQMEPIPPTVYVHLAVPRHFLRVLTKIHAQIGRIAPPAIASLPTEPITPTVFAAAALQGRIPPPPTLSLAPRGQRALQGRR